MRCNSSFLYLMFSIFCLLLLHVGCSSGNPELENAQAIKDRSEQKTVTGKPAEDLKANAIEETDVKGRVEWSLGRVQEELAYFIWQVTRHGRYIGIGG